MAMVTEDDVARVYAEQGYLVVNMAVGAKVGDVFQRVLGGRNCPDLERPFVIRAVADRADWNAQCKRLRMRPRLIYPAEIFYRVTTD